MTGETRRGGRRRNDRSPLRKFHSADDVEPIRSLARTKSSEESIEYMSAALNIFKVDIGKARRKEKLKGVSVRFPDSEKKMLVVKEFDEDEAPLTITKPNHKSEDHNQIPWDEADYEEIPWWDQPDLDEDDELTALCKRVLVAGATGSTGQHEIQADRVQSLVIEFALKARAKIEKHGKDWVKEIKRESLLRQQQSSGIPLIDVSDLDLSDDEDEDVSTPRLECVKETTPSTIAESDEESESESPETVTVTPVANPPARNFSRNDSVESTGSTSSWRSSGRRVPSYLKSKDSTAANERPAVKPVSPTAQKISRNDSVESTGSASSPGRRYGRNAHSPPREPDVKSSVPSLEGQSDMPIWALKSPLRKARMGSVDVLATAEKQKSAEKIRQSSIEWEKPDWATKSPLKSTSRGSRLRKMGTVRGDPRALPEGGVASTGSRLRSADF